MSFQTPLKSWLFQASIRNCLNCVHNCNDHSSLDFKIGSSIYETSHVSLQTQTYFNVRVDRISKWEKNASWSCNHEPNRIKFKIDDRNSFSRPWPLFLRKAKLLNFATRTHDLILPLASAKQILLEAQQTARQVTQRLILKKYLYSLFCEFHYRFTFNSLRNLSHLKKEIEH